MMHRPTHEILWQSLRGAVGAVALLLVIALGGCVTKENSRPANAAPLEYHGPQFLHGTIGSMALMRGMEPIIVSNFGFVAGLNGTGSAEIPPYLREEIINLMTKAGVKDPLVWLSDPNTTLVRVQGQVPFGAVKGDRFDLLVTAIDSQTTSLEGGRLFQTELAKGGANTAGMYRMRSAKGSGPLYLQPLAETQTDAAPQRRRAVVLAGGVCTAPRKIEIILRQPGWSRVRTVADRINERFPHENRTTRFFDTAIAETNQKIRINLPGRYRGRAEEFIHLIRHLFLERGETFQKMKAQALADMLVKDQEHRREVLLTWQAQGNLIVPVIRRYYNHPNLGVRLTAIEAGARLNDSAAAKPLKNLSLLDDPQYRFEVARILKFLPDHLVGNRTLLALLDDNEAAVRLRAYESLAEIDDPQIFRAPMGTPGSYKFLLEVVPARKPLIYVAHGQVPRIAVFSRSTRMQIPAIAGVWDNRLMFKQSQENGLINVFYQEPGQVSGTTSEIIPDVPELIVLMAEPRKGLDLSYSRVVDALNQLCAGGYIDAPIKIQQSTLAQEISQHEQRQLGQKRPETDSSDGWVNSSGQYLPLVLDKEAIRDLSLDFQKEENRSRRLEDLGAEPPDSPDLAPVPRPETSRPETGPLPEP